MLQNKTDEQLMTEYLFGDDAAFAVLYERHSAKVFGYLRARTSNEAVARDIFQSTFMKLHQTRDRYRPDLPFLPWLFTLCRHELIDAMRKRNRNREDPTEHLPDVSSESVVTASAQINLAVLPLTQKIAVQLRYEEDLPFEQIATRLNTSPANARQLVSRGIKALRKWYGE